MKNYFYSILVVAMLGVAPMPLFADEDVCTDFSPAFVLCTVHSHNVGFGDGDGSGAPKNPESADQIAEMNEVIAYKSTVIAQQLKKQYDILNSIIKRFKVQLEKAVLQSKIEVATGTSSSDGGYSGSSSYGGDSGLAGAQDCDAISDFGQMYDCIIANMAKVQSSASSNRADAQRQLYKDWRNANDSSLCYVSGKNDERGKCDITCGSGSKIKDVESLAQGKSSVQAKDITDCAKALARRLRSDKSKYENEQARSHSGWRN